MNSDLFKRLEYLLKQNSDLLTMEGSRKILDYARNSDNYFAKISSLGKEGVYSFRGVISSIGKIRVMPRDDKDLKLLKFEISDDTGSITVNLWNNEIDYYSDLVKEGNALSFIDCRLTINNFGHQFSLGDKGFITPLSD